MADMLLQSVVVTKRLLEEVLKRGREDQDLTQDEVAAMIGKTQQTVLNYEKGRRIPNIVDLGIMGRAYELDWNDLQALQKEAKARRSAGKIPRLPKGASAADRTIMQLRTVIAVLSQQVEELAEAVDVLKNAGTTRGRPG